MTGWHKPALVYVRWFDSSIYKGESCQADNLAISCCENESAGILLEETDVHIALALDRCLDTGDVRCVLCVPKVNVRSIHRF